jgi:hypothetical protein
MGYKRHRNNYDFGLFDLILKPIINEIKPKIKGAIGEIGIGIVLGMLDSSIYKTLNNRIIETKSKTTQIDHIVVSNYGVFVIETKNYKGLIFGNDESTYWTQALYGSKEQFYNPVKQNLGHIQALRECLAEYGSVEIHSIIVFSEDAELKVNSPSVVGYPMDMLDYIKSCNEIVLSDTKRDSIIAKLNGLKIENQNLEKEHINNLKKGAQEKERKIFKNLCPKCGGQLVPRQGKYGSFKGCSNYPKCKFTAKL